MKQWYLLIALCLGIVLIWLAYGSVFVARNPFGEDWTRSGQFGDAFGALNALFSGLALAGVIYALRLQMQELALQREEMAQSRDELKRTADAQSAQVELLARQIGAMEEGQRAERELRDKQSEVRLRFTGAPTTGRMREIGLENHGPQVSELEAQPLGEYSVRIIPTDLLGHRQVLTAKVDFKNVPPNVVCFQLSYTDVNGGRRHCIVEVNITDRKVRTLQVGG